MRTRENNTFAEKTNPVGPVGLSSRDSPRSCESHLNDEKRLNFCGLFERRHKTTRGALESTVCQLTHFSSD